MGDRKRNDIKIPPEALVGRPIFFERPGADIEAEILDFIRETYAPHLWRGHTHTKPSKGELFEYINDYQLLPGREAPCPCCSPVRPKYWRKGVIVWFPREGVIRLLGGYCFKRMMGLDAHRAALKKREGVKRHRANIAINLQNVGALPATLSAINQVIPIANAVDRFRDELRSGDIGKFTRGLLRHAKEGALYIEEKGGKLRRYASIAGQSILSPAIKPVSPRMRSARTILASLELSGDPEECVRAMNDKDAERFAKVISAGVKIVKDALADIEEMRQFVSDQTLATLRTWGKEDGCPYPTFVKKEYRAFLIGASPPGTVISLDEAFGEPLPIIRDLGK
jgi:hypothetical protein